MTVGEIKKQPSRESKLSHTLESKKTKPTSNHTVTNKQTAAKSIYYNRRASCRQVITFAFIEFHPNYELSCCKIVFFCQIYRNFIFFVQLFSISGQLFCNFLNTER